MRILAFSDLHRKEKVYEAIRSLLFRRRYDLILVGGDTTEYDDVDFLDDVLELSSRTPLYIIPGNMEDSTSIDFMRSSNHYVDGKLIDLAGNYQLVGIGGAPKGPFGTPNEYVDDQLCEKFNSIKPDPSKHLIVLSHSPPYKYFDEVANGVHVGSKCVSKLIQKWSPSLVLCGHIHEHSGQTKVGSTNIVKLPAAKEGKVAELVLSHGSLVKYEIIDFFEEN